MNIVIIHGQSHTGSTCHIARMLADRLGGELAEVFLPRDFSDICTGCTLCIMRDEALCPHHARLQPILEAMDRADVIILASPVYVYHVTGAMKSFLDHLGYRWLLHRPAAGMFTKQGVAISTAAGGGTRSTNRDMLDSMFYWGVGKRHAYGIAVYATRWEGVTDRRRARIERDVDRLARRILRSAGHVRPGLKTKAFFHMIRMLVRRGGWNEPDAEHWTRMGWTGSVRPWKH